MHNARRTSGAVAAVATVLLGWLLLLPHDPPGLFARWSYDLLQPLLPARPDTNTIIVYMDEQAVQDYRQTNRLWDRAIHARFLDRLSRDQPRVVVFDVEFTQALDLGTDRRLAEAIGRNGRVVLAAGLVPVIGVKGSTDVPPETQFQTNAAAWGIAKVQLDPDQVVRRDHPGSGETPGLAWAAATLAGAGATRDPARRREPRWLNYYGSARPFAGRSMSYTNAESSEAGFFKGKTVFIGGKPETLWRGDPTDVYSTPFPAWSRRRAPGVEFVAIAYSNLLHDDWLRRAGLFSELGILLATGVVAGCGGARIRLRAAVWLTIALAAVLIAASLWLVLSAHYWFPWAIGVVGQLPCALLFRLFAARAPDSTPASASDASPVIPAPGLQAAQLAAALPLGIPDHTLIRCIGEGAYGQVWVARNAIGLYHAVKVLYRSRFGTATPYERALRGIQKFMPVSRSHGGFVHILHVGHNEAGGFFFYIMEAGDDQKVGQAIDPASYAPKTLASELKQREMIPPRECLELMLALTEALHRLHGHQLIHRDIKPANIIFVHGRPKLADIDLVTDLSLPGEVSRIGTDGYMAPEGPGTAAADVFSLGRVFYVALSGKSPEQSPELPTRITSHPDCALFLELNQIACKACETDLGRRYGSAAAMRADLQALARRLDSSPAGSAGPPQR